MTPRIESAIPRLPRRAADSHKGTYGRILLVGGSRGMSGAISLAGMSALRSGAGLVFLAVPESILDVVAGFEPAYITIPLPADSQGHIAESAFDILQDHAARADAIALGPGLGRSDGLTRIVRQLYTSVDKPMVVDADALNALAASMAGSSDLLPKAAGPRVLTPHPGEFARLTRTTPALSRDEACQFADELAARDAVTIVLKGHRTHITDGCTYATNGTGNPGMATGGTGDVLTGMIAALLAQPIELPTPAASNSLQTIEHLAGRSWMAARLAVHVHGLAGDLAARELGEVSLIASDLVRYLPSAYRQTDE